MCVAAFAWAAHPRWRLVAIGNRDEYHERPAAPLARWEDGSGIIAGVDLRSGGTWLGVSQAGRFALVTNLRGYGDPQPDRVSRGALVTDFLRGSRPYAEPQVNVLDDFNPFNLITAGSDGAHFLSNRPDKLRTALASGIYGLSNGSLDEPWPKTLRLKAGMLGWLTAGHDDSEALFQALADETLPDVGLHPRQPSDVKREAPETPVFIHDSIYGTRCSTVVLVDVHGRGVIRERRFDAAGKRSGESEFRFAWPTAGA